MDHYAGIDVSLECSSVCVVDGSGKIVGEGKVASEPEALIGEFGSLRPAVVRIGLKAGPVAVALRGDEGSGFGGECWRRGMCTMRSRRCR